MDTEDQIKNIQQKLQQLLKLYQHAQKENRELKAAFLIQQNELAENAQQMQQLQVQLSAAQLTGSTQSEAQKIDLQKRIDGYLKEIDKCLVLLRTK